MATWSAGDLAAITGAECSIAPLDTPLPSQVAHTIPIPRPSTAFLVLAPVTSSDYPLPSSFPTPSNGSTIAKERGHISAQSSLGSAADVAASAVTGEQGRKDRRSSSISSDGSFKIKFLKLGPVYNGGDHSVSDYVELEKE